MKTKRLLLLVIPIMILRFALWWLNEANVWVENNSIWLNVPIGSTYYRQGMSEVILLYGHRLKCFTKQVQCKDFGMVAEMGGKLEGVVKVNKWGERELWVNRVQVDQWQNSFLKPIVEIRSRLLSNYKSIYSEPHGLLIAGMLLGKQVKFEPQFEDNLRRVGITHVVAASGYNVVIVIMVTMKLLLIFVKRQKAIFIACLMIGIYLLLAGMTPAVVRAGIMSMLMIAASFFGREYLAGYSLWLVGAVMLFWQPGLIMDISFLLSMSATVGMIYLSPIMAKLIFNFQLTIFNQILMFKFSNLEKYIKTFSELLGQTLAAIIATLPIILYYFESFSLIAPLANLVLLPMVPILMLTGALSGFLGLFSLTLAYFVGLITWPLVNIFVVLVNFLGEFEWAMIEVTQVRLELLVGWWLFWWGVYIFMRHRKSSL